MSGRSLFCPGCRRFIGPALRCRYCDAPADHAGTALGLRVGAVGVAIAGLLALAGADAHRQAREMAVGDIGPALHYSPVTVTGVVASRPWVARDGGAISLRLDDGSGVIAVKASGDDARRLRRAAAPWPRRGDVVRVEARVQARNDGDAVLMVGRSATLTVVDRKADDSD